ncbi:MAG: glycosyltransferase family 39 protein [Acidobacteriota bacterium]
MPENSKTPGEKQPFKWTWLKLLAVVSTVFVYFFGLTIPLVGPDEPRYAQVAREMYERSDWITPTLGGFNWFEKPALLYWLEIAAYNIFGVSEFSARFGSALFGLGTIASLWILAKYRDRGAETNIDSGSGFGFADWTAVITASTIGIIVFSRGASFDIILTFPITAALTGFFVYERARDGRGRYSGLLGFYFFIGVSLLAKGLVGIVFPFAIAGVYYFIAWKFPNRTFLISVIWGTVISAAVAAVWYVPMYMTHGYAFIDEFIIQHHFQRFTSNKYFHPQPFYFFFWVLPLMTIPWLPFFLAAVWKAVRGFVSEPLYIGPETSESVQNGDRDYVRFALAWIIVPLAFFSFSGSKLPGYILPAVPGTILLTADLVFNFVRNRPRRAFVLQAVAAATFAIVVAATIFVVPGFADDDSVKTLIAAADSKGFAASKVVCLHVVSHNAEFYAAGRLIRANDGKLKKLLGPAEVRESAKAQNGTPLLVLVPIEYLHQVENAEYLNSTVIAANGELAIVAVTDRPS